MSDIHALSGAYAVDALDDIERASSSGTWPAARRAAPRSPACREAAAAAGRDATADAARRACATAVLADITQVRPLPPVSPAGRGPVAPPERWFPALVARGRPRPGRRRRRSSGSRGATTTSADADARPTRSSQARTPQQVTRRCPAAATGHRRALRVKLHRAVIVDRGHAAPPGRARSTSCGCRRRPRTWSRPA